MIGACWGLACSEALPSPYPGFPLERASRSQLAGVTPSPVPTRWDGKDYLLFSAARRRRRYQRISQSCCSGAAWWTPGGAYIEHARAGVVTIHLARRTGARHIVRPRRPQPSAHIPATHRRDTYTHTSSPRCSSPLAPHGLARSLRHAYTHVPSPHISSLRAVLGA